ncbi:FAD-dependent oxidoreductase [uncultured Campylobacter sp.]|uniref:FAD-dependent oxidoreductase n=1 Tax=uncultured Campylobacter sp. TaxID=218934 RepID=UPI00262EF2B7|nr:FAD-dependent oxidoreductase [uncultured Campylobacter sp.]
MDDEIFDVVVVGGGVAGLISAYELAKKGYGVVLLERGSEAGSKNLSGGVFYSRIMEEIFPDFLNEAPIERKIMRNVVSFLNEGSAVNLEYQDERLLKKVNAVSVLRAKFYAWLASKCEEAGVMMMPGLKVDSLLKEGDTYVGVKAGDDELKARITILADGVNSFLAQAEGIRPKQPPKFLAVGVKSVIALSKKTIEDRFRVRNDEGVAYAVVGECTKGIAGGGFLYTNKDSISIGVVMQLQSLSESGLSSSEVHDKFLSHPAIAPLIEGGELLEYGCHLTIEDGPQMVLQQEISRAGLLIVGDAAGFSLNTGLTLRGMDLAAGSALAAVRAADSALKANEFSAKSLGKYRNEFDNDWIGKDMKTYESAPKFFTNPRLYGDYGKLIADIFYRIFNLDLSPRKHLRSVMIDAFKASSIKYTINTFPLGWYFFIFMLFFKYTIALLLQPNS